MCPLWNHFSNHTYIFIHLAPISSNESSLLLFFALHCTIEYFAYYFLYRFKKFSIDKVYYCIIIITLTKRGMCPLLGFWWWHWRTRTVATTDIPTITMVLTKYWPETRQGGSTFHSWGCWGSVCYEQCQSSPPKKTPKPTDIYTYVHIHKETDLSRAQNLKWRA